MPTDDGWREMRYRVYRHDPETGEECVLREGLVRLHSSAIPEELPTSPTVCHCPQHKGAVLEL